MTVRTTRDWLTVSGLACFFHCEIVAGNFGQIMAGNPLKRKSLCRSFMWLRSISIEFFRDSAEIISLDSNAHHTRTVQLWVSHPFQDSVSSPVPERSHSFSISHFSRNTQNSKASIHWLIIHFQNGNGSPPTAKFVFIACLWWMRLLTLRHKHTHLQLNRATRTSYSAKNVSGKQRQAELLRSPWRSAERERKRHQKGLPQAGSQVRCFFVRYFLHSWACIHSLSKSCDIMGTRTVTVYQAEENGPVGLKHGTSRWHFLNAMMYVCMYVRIFMYVCKLHVCM